VESGVDKRIAAGEEGVLAVRDEFVDDESATSETVVVIVSVVENKASVVVADAELADITTVDNEATDVVAAIAVVVAIAVGAYVGHVVV
jgi:hypothetical protein